MTVNNEIQNERFIAYNNELESLHTIIKTRKIQTEKEPLNAATIFWQKV